MTYSDEEMAEIERDPVRLKAYFWNVVQGMRRIAAKNRARSQATGVNHPVTNYLPAFEEGADAIHWANTLDRVADCILEDLDAWVTSTLVGAPHG